MRELLGVYDADGGLRGEAAYVVGKLLGRRHCGLCDITHSPLRRKPAWDAFVAGLEVPFRLRHLNELTAAEAQAVAAAGAPVVLAVEDGRFDVLVDSAAMDELGGDVDRFAELVTARLADRSWIREDCR